MASVKKFKSEIGDDIYKNRVNEYAAKKDVEAAIKVCDACEQLQFCHEPGPCTRSDKSKFTNYDSKQISEIASAINKDIIEKIISDAKSSSTKSDEPVHDRLAAALDKISEVLDQRRPVHSQVTKVKVPPTWAKESYTDYKAEVEAWESAHPGDDFSKYSELLTELKRNKTKPGLSDYVSTIVVERTRDEKSVGTILKVLQEKYELTKKEKFENLISDFKNFKPGRSESGESIYSQIERLVTQFEYLKIKKNMNYFLSIFIVRILFENEILSEIEKRMVEETIEQTDEKEIILAVKKSFRKMKVEGKRENIDVINENKTFYASGYERSRYGSWKNSRDFKDFSRTKSNNWRTKSGNRWRKSESSHRPTSRSQSQSRKSESEFMSLKDLNNAMQQVMSKLKSLDENQVKLSKLLDNKIVDSKFVETDYIEEDWSNASMNIYFMKDIKNVNELVADCGAPKTLIGQCYLEEYLKFQNLSKSDLNVTPCKQKFRFGPSQVYVSTEKAKIPILFESPNGPSKQYIESYVIQADVPFL